MITDNITPDPAVPAFIAKAPTRAAGTFLAVATPAEFFGVPKHIADFTRVVGGRFARRQKFYDRRDAAQDAAVVALEAARRWTPDHGVPFGGFAYRSALLWCSGAMLRASVPVTGCESRAATEGVRYSSLDAPRGGADGSTATLGERLDEASCIGVRSTRPDEFLLLQETLNDIRETADDLTDEVFDAVVAVMVGAKVLDEDLPPGWSEASLIRMAERVRAELQVRVGVQPTRPATPAAPVHNPWA